MSLPRLVLLSQGEVLPWECLGMLKNGFACHTWTVRRALVDRGWSHCHHFIMYRPASVTKHHEDGDKPCSRYALCVHSDLHTDYHCSGTCTSDCSHLHILSGMHQMVYLGGNSNSHLRLIAKWLCLHRGTFVMILTSGPLSRCVF